MDSESQIEDCSTVATDADAALIAAASGLKADFERMRRPVAIDSVAKLVVSDNQKSMVDHDYSDHSGDSDIDRSAREVAQ